MLTSVWAGVTEGVKDARWISATPVLIKLKELSILLRDVSVWFGAGIHRQLRGTRAWKAGGVVRLPTKRSGGQERALVQVWN